MKNLTIFTIEAKEYRISSWNFSLHFINLREEWEETHVSCLHVVYLPQRKQQKERSAAPAGKYEYKQS